MKQISAPEIYTSVPKTMRSRRFSSIKEGIDPTYLKIYDGQWKNDAPYGVVHRITSSGKVKGAASFCLDWAFSQCGNLKIDTHENNVVMQNLLKKNGFTYCGRIYVDDGGERLAFQK